MQCIAAKDAIHTSKKSSTEIQSFCYPMKKKKHWKWLLDHPKSKIGYEMSTDESKQDSVGIDNKGKLYGT